MNDRIKLAEAQGWKRDEKWNAWILQVNAKQREIVRDANLLPDPFTDANACNVLIKHLNSLGYSFRIEYWSDLIGSKDNFYAVEIEASNPSGNGYFQWRGDNWMHGVCELALKVIE